MRLHMPDIDNTGFTPQQRVQFQILYFRLWGGLPLYEPVSCIRDDTGRWTLALCDMLYEGPQLLPLLQQAVDGLLGEEAFPQLEALRRRGLRNAAAVKAGVTRPVVEPPWWSDAPERLREYLDDADARGFTVMSTSTGAEHVVTCQGKRPRAGEPDASRLVLEVAEYVWLHAHWPSGAQLGRYRRFPVFTSGSLRGGLLDG